MGRVTTGICHYIGRLAARFPVCLVETGKQENKTPGFLERGSLGIALGSSHLDSKRVWSMSGGWPRA